MYLDYFGLGELPFNVTPSPRFLYLGSGHRRAMDLLLYGVKQRKGFIVLTGDVGTGKTTLCRALLDRLGRDYRTALILNPCLSETQLLRAIVTELGISDARGDRLKLREMLNACLLDELAARRDVVLIIDEAQHLGLDLLEQVRLLSNLETDDRKLLQIVLAGQPELAARLADPRIRQLRQRITVRCNLQPITYQETEDYIRHRLAVAGGNGQPSFDPGAVQIVYEHSSGVPRLVNAICDMALLAAYTDQQVRVDRRHVESAVNELQESLT